ncbi:hypothetical protein TI39_contig285g00016 [Zymoseptoria brevis]|uniref:GPI anchored protein n=1 Tax=Zymoseptoria brevis TaxID=1047168 RepID=A0A0F4GZG5_9PEZI|nr:hypothetical protein TI39_contig285g00016 [Zymoseptoria brevis]
MSTRLASSATLLAFFHLCAAQSTILTIPFYGYDDQSIVASIVSADSTATILHLNCPPGTDQNDCGLFPSQTLTIGPSTYHMDLSGDGFTGTQECMSTSICVESNEGEGANFSGVSTTTYTAEELESMPVTVTAGASLLGRSGAAATTSGASEEELSSSATAELTTLTGGRPQETGTSSSSGSMSSTSSADPQATETGGAAANVGLLGGVLAAAAGVLGFL